ncbi:MAG: DUF3450 family protein [Candidatus Omnitrophica bacterium]|nr:DUF3450 family protein [Candidatus Omnitrophota bacterium]
MTKQMLRTFLCVFGLMVLALPARAQNEDVENTRTALEKWVETRRLISQEQQDLELSKEMLNERIDVLEQEIKSLKDKIKDAESSITEADKKRAGLLEDNEKLKQASAVLDQTVVQLEQKTAKLLEHLPDPIRERVKPLSQRFPENPEETKLSLAERFQNVIGVLNEVNKFNRDVNIVSEVRDLPDGTTAEVTTLYVGVGQGYYASANGKIAGTGYSSPSQGWVWTPANDAADEIMQAIAIMKNEQVATFVQVPVKIQ